MQGQAEAQQALAQLAEVRAQAAAEAAAHEALMQEASQKAARLARLEGMPPHSLQRAEALPFSACHRRNP